MELFVTENTESFGLFWGREYQVRMLVLEVGVEPTCSVKSAGF